VPPSRRFQGRHTLRRSTGQEKYPDDNQASGPSDEWNTLPDGWVVDPAKQPRVPDSYHLSGLSREPAPLRARNDSYAAGSLAVGIFSVLFGGLVECRDHAVAGVSEHFPADCADRAVNDLIVPFEHRSHGVAVLLPHRSRPDDVGHHEQPATPKRVLAPARGVEDRECEAMYCPDRHRSAPR
jgi:hypothetical protein